jgi:hypothetical protein
VVSGRAALPDLSRRDLAILEGLDRWGFLTGGQLQRGWFDLPDATPVGARRRAQRVMRRLLDHGLVHRLDRRQGGSRGGSDSFIYRLGHRGRTVLKIEARGSRREPSQRFVDHSLAISEVAVQLIEAERAGAISQLALGAEPAIWRRFTTPAGIEVLKPDLLVELTATDGWELRWFVEVDRGTEHLPTVITKCQLYERYWRSGHETTLHEVFPRVAWSVPDPPRAERIRSAIGRTRSLTPDLFRVVTAPDTAALLINQAPDTTKGGQP